MSTQSTSDNEEENELDNAALLEKEIIEGNGVIETIELTYNRANAVVKKITEANMDALGETLHKLSVGLTEQMGEIANNHNDTLKFTMSRDRFNVVKEKAQHLNGATVLLDNLERCFTAKTKEFIIGISYVTTETETTETNVSTSPHNMTLLNKYPELKKIANHQLIEYFDEQLQVDGSYENNYFDSNVISKRYDQYGLWKLFGIKVPENVTDATNAFKEELGLQDLSNEEFYRMQYRIRCFRKIDRIKNYDINDPVEALRMNVKKAISNPRRFKPDQFDTSTNSWNFDEANVRYDNYRKKLSIKINGQTIYMHTPKITTKALLGDYHCGMHEVCNAPVKVDIIDVGQIDNDGMPVVDDDGAQVIIRQKRITYPNYTDRPLDMCFFYNIKALKTNVSLRNITQKFE